MTGLHIVAEKDHPHAGQPLLRWRVPPGEARIVGILLHGRGASARDILGLTDHFSAPDIAWLAPQAAGSTWYPHPFLAPLEQNEPWLGSALRVVDGLAEELGRQEVPPLAPTFEAIRRANGGHMSAERLERALAECWRHPLDWVAREYGFSEEMLAAGWEVNRTAEVPVPMRGYGDLDVLPSLAARRILVTSGFRRLQESKVRALGLAPWFDRIEIDAIDEADRLGKEGHFRAILQEHALAPREVLVVGDNADSEIAAGNRLGMPTAQTLRPGVPATATADHAITSFHELPALLEHYRRHR